MTIIEFSNLGAEEQCKIINNQIEQYGKKGFKTDSLDFSFSQAKKVLKSEIKEVNGKFLTKNQLFEMLNKEEESERQPLELTEEEIAMLKTLLDSDRWKALMSITENYSYVKEFILKADTGIKLHTPRGTLKTTTIRTYERNWEDWKAFCNAHKPYSNTDLLNTALYEFMSRHGWGSFE